MAGSRAWYVYSSDDATAYAVELDEDTGTLGTTGFIPYTGEPALDLPPQGLKMRYVNAVQTSGDGAGFRSRRVFCGTTTSDLFSGDIVTFELNGLQYAVSSTRGERKRNPKAQPTGLVGPSATVGVGSNT